MSIGDGELLIASRSLVPRAEHWAVCGAYLARAQASNAAVISVAGTTPAATVSIHRCNETPRP